MLAPLSAECELVQFDSLPDWRVLTRLGELLEDRPDVALRAYGGYDGTIADLEFLRHFPRLKRFHADALRYRDFTGIDGLRFLPDDLVELHLGDVGRRFSLQPIGRFTSLQTLHLEGKWKDVDVIRGLTELEELELCSITLPDLSILTALPRLRRFALRLGGTRDLGLLPSVAELAYLELWMIRGLDDISPIGELQNLQYLFLQDLSRVDRLPDMTRMTALRRVRLENLRSLTDLRPLLTAPALEALVVWSPRHLGPEHFACLKDHPTLTHARIALGSMKRNQAVSELLPLPAPQPFAFAS